MAEFDSRKLFNMTNWQLAKKLARSTTRIASVLHEEFHLWELPLRSEFETYQEYLPVGSPMKSGGWNVGKTGEIRDSATDIKDTRHTPIYGENCTINATSTMMFAELRFYVYVIVVGVLCILGIVFNVISVLVLNRDFQTTITFFLKSLAVTDILSLVMMLLHHTFSSFYPHTGLLEEYYRKSVYMIPYIWPLRMTVNTVGMLVITAITIDRFIRVCHPNQARNWGQLKHAYITLAVIIIVSISVNIPRFFVIKTVHLEQRCTSRVFIFNDLTKFCKEYYAMIYALDLVAYFVPVIAMVIFNTILMVKIQRSRRKQLQHNENSNYSGRAASNVTATLITIVIIFIVCETPIRIYRLLLHVQKGSAERYLEQKKYAYKMQLAGDTLTTFHCFVNLFVFAFVGNRFRKILIHLMCCRPGNWQTYSSIASPRSRTFLLREHGYN